MDKLNSGHLFPQKNYQNKGADSNPQENSASLSYKVIEHEDGSVFKGDLTNGRAQGYGRFELKGYSYEGKFWND